uniref:Uncharacterized protein n=1 Tax=Arundo donax TaxID=35708 RepID=A0A0A9CHX8_ARUDO
MSRPCSRATAPDGASGVRGAAAGSTRCSRPLEKASERKRRRSSASGSAGAVGFLTMVPP